MIGEKIFGLFAGKKQAEQTVSSLTKNEKKFPAYSELPKLPDVLPAGFTVSGAGAEADQKNAYLRAYVAAHESIAQNPPEWLKKIKETSSPKVNNSTAEIVATWEYMQNHIFPDTQLYFYRGSGYEHHLNTDEVYARNFSLAKIDTNLVYASKDPQGVIIRIPLRSVVEAYKRTHGEGLEIFSESAHTALVRRERGIPFVPEFSVSIAFTNPELTLEDIGAQVFRVEKGQHPTQPFLAFKK